VTQQENNAQSAAEVIGRASFCKVNALMTDKTGPEKISTDSGFPAPTGRESKIGFPDTFSSIFAR